MAISYSYAIMASLFWGAGFIGSRYGLEAFTPMWITFLRFMIASIFLLPLFLKVKKTDFNKTSIIGASICGVLLTFMIFLQVTGLQYTTVAKSGFITITYAFITPLVCRIIFKQKLSMFFWSSLSLALVGIFLLCDMNLSNLNYGDLLTFVGALIASAHLLLISHFAKKLKTLNLFNIIQMLSVCCVSFVLSLLMEGSNPVKEGHIFNNLASIAGVVFMGIFSTSIAFVFQTKSQKFLKPHIAGLIFLLESPFAAVLGFLIFNETLTFSATFGCLMVMVSVMIIPMEMQFYSMIKLMSLKLRPVFVYRRAASFVSLFVLTIFVFNYFSI